MSYVPMIMNMNKKGRQTKLLAAIAVLAMVVCAFAVVMPSDNVSGDTVAPATIKSAPTEDFTVESSGVYYVVRQEELSLLPKHLSREPMSDL